MLVWLCLTVLLPCSLAAKDLDTFKPADTSSPRATLTSFIDACNELYDQVINDRYVKRTGGKTNPGVMRILDCLDLSQLPEFEQFEAAGETAICLKEILDRVELPTLNEMPGSDEVNDREEGDPLLRWRIPGTRLTIARMEEGPRRHEYLFSSGTVERSVSYYRDMSGLPYRQSGLRTSPGFHDWYFTAPGHPGIAKLVDQLPEWWRRKSLAGTANWKWFGLLTATVLGLTLLTIVYRIYIRLGEYYKDKSVPAYFFTILVAAAAVPIPYLVRNFAYQHLTLRGEPLYVVSYISVILTMLGLIVLTFGLTGRVAAAIIASPGISPKGLDAQFIRILTKLTGLIAFAVIILEGGRYLGIPISTLLASAGIGGLAIALAAQDTLKTLFGTVMLLTDKPFRVGERIVFGKYDGVVEDLGLRSTRVRLLNGHQVTVPNDELAKIDIENIGRRPHIRRTTVLELPSETKVHQVRKALDILRDALKNHEGMHADFPPRVYFRDFKERAIGIFFIYWYHPADYWSFLAFSERINLKIMEDLEEAGIKFAAPALTVSMPESESQAAQIMNDQRRPR